MHKFYSKTMTGQIGIAAQVPALTSHPAKVLPPHTKQSCTERRLHTAKWLMLGKRQTLVLLPSPLPLLLPQRDLHRPQQQKQLLRLTLSSFFASSAGFFVGVAGLAVGLGASTGASPADWICRRTNDIQLLLPMILSPDETHLHPRPVA